MCDSSGLGLTTVAHIVKSMGGNISVASELGKGSTFRVEIPFKIVESHMSSIEEPEEDQRLKLQFDIQNKYLSSITSGSSNVSTMDHAPIMIAEDNPINRKVICKLVNSLGFKVDSVTDGVELVEKCNPKQHKIVITDMVSLCNLLDNNDRQNMPNMNGLDAAKILRERHGQNVKIYLLTGNVLMKSTEGVLDVCDGIITKPCTKTELMSILNDIKTVPVQ